MQHFCKWILRSGAVPYTGLWGTSLSAVHTLPAAHAGRVNDTKTIEKSNATTSTSTNSEEFIGHIPIDALQISYSYSSGPGGQHVNKTKSKVEVRFHIPSASWIPDIAKHKIFEREAHRITKDQYFVISSDRTRKQILNQADCLERIRRMIRECLDATKKPAPDPETLEMISRRLAAQNESRLREKKTISFTKQQRQKPTLHDLRSE